MPYREAPRSALSGLFVAAPIPLTRFTLLPLTLALSVACRGFELWAIVATSAVSITHPSEAIPPTTIVR